MRNGANSQGMLVALCGPSGVGKGYTKELIRQSVPVSFSEPVVCTTRVARIDDGASRRTGISEQDFAKLVRSGEIVLAHQPFRQPDSPWYGFDAESLEERGHILTEVHSTVLSEFGYRFVGRHTLMVGLVSDEATRMRNIKSRQTIEASELDIRMKMGQLEIGEINAGFAAGIVSAVFDCSIGLRQESQARAVSLVRRDIEGAA